MVDLILALVVAAVVTAPLLVVGVVVGSGFFSLLHVPYFALVVTVPLVATGTMVIARPDLRTHRLLAVSAALLLLPAPLGIYMSHVEPGWLRVDHFELAIDPARSGTGPVRLGVISDIQTADVGDHEFRAVRELVAQRPDVIVVPGDLFQMDEATLVEQTPRLRELLNGLDAPFGVYVVPGDVDGTDRVRRVLEGTDLVLLDDETVRVPVAGRELLIGGITRAYADPGATVVRDELLAEPADGAITVFLSHRPDAVLTLPPASRVDLTVSGHTHGGQVILPGIGPLLTATDVPRDVARGGLHELSDNSIYVSPGVGAERGGAPQVRLLDRPSVAVIELG